MRFSISHLLTLILIVAVTLTVRSIAYFAKDYGLIPLLAVAISGLLSFLLSFFGSRTRNAISWGILLAATIIGTHILECLCRTETSEYIWAYVSGGDEIFVYLLVALITLFASLIATSLAASFAKFIVTHWKWD